MLMQRAAGEEVAVDNPLAVAVLNQVDLPEIVVSTADKNIDYFFDWVHRRKIDIVLYFPREELKSALSNPEIPGEVSGQLATIIPQLPDCLDQAAIDAGFPKCQTGDLAADTSRIEAKLDEFYPKLAASDNFLDQSLTDTGFQNLGQETPLMSLIQNQDEAARKQAETVLQTLEDLISSSAILSIMLIVVSVILSLIDMTLGVLHWRSVLARISSIYLIAGLLILLIGAIGTFSPDTYISLIPGSGSNLLSASFSAATTDFYHQLSAILFQLTLFLGAVITIISFLLRLIAMLLPQTAQERSKTQTIGEDLPVDNTLAPGLSVPAQPASGSIISDL
jgi:hypothetical protein